MAAELPTQAQVDAAIFDALHKLGFYALEPGTPEKRRLATMVADALPGLVHRAHATG
jgi:hypothetical protein